VLWAAALAAVLGAYLTLVALPQTWSSAGDPYASYFPTARALLDGEGLDAYGPMFRGQARMPLYPTLLAAASAVTPTLARAAQVLNVLAWAATMFVVALALAAWGQRRAAPLVLAGLAMNRVVGRTAAEATPDAFFALAVTVALAAIAWAWERGPRGFFIAGALAGVVVLTRFNGVSLILAVPVVLCLFRARRRHALWYFAGALVALTPIAVLWAWLGSRGISYPNFYLKAQNLAGHEAVATGSVIHSALSGVWDMPWRLRDAGVHQVAFFLAVATFAVASYKRGAVFVIAVGLASLLGIMAPMHHEGRYQVPFAPALLSAGAVGALYLVDKLRRWRELAYAAISIAWLLMMPRGLAMAVDEWGRRIEESVKARDACDDLLQADAKRPLIVGVPRERYHYNRLRGCSLIADLPITLVPASRSTFGLDLFVEDDDTLSRSAPFDFKTAAALDDSQTLRVPLPSGLVHKRERVIEVPHTPGTELVAYVHTPPAQALALTVGEEDFVLATNDETRRYVLPRKESVRVRYGAADGLLPGDEIVWRLAEEPAR
jgi:hypothetical protein